ncbi:Z385C protein, partial [Sylvia atricapilla]|nr:Z385C protein [Sylvia atricapilla]
HSPESAVQLAEEASCPPSQPEQRMKREKKHQSFTLCEVCNIQLNSAAQAQIHYNGKSHQKRLKQLNKGKMPAAQVLTLLFPSAPPGPSGHSSPLLASPPLPGRPLHPPLDINPPLTFRLNGTSPLNLFPNFNTMDPVQNPPISHTFGMPAPLKTPPFISCNICHLRFNPPNQAPPHYKGHKHARRLKPPQAMKNKQKVVGAAPPTPGQDSTADLAPTPPGSGELGSTGMRRPPRAEEAELPGSVAPPPPPPASELSEGTSDPPRVASSSAQAAETHPPESGSSISSAPESAPPGKKSKQHLYCPTPPLTCPLLPGAKHKSPPQGHGTQLRRGRGNPPSRAGHKSKRIGNTPPINIQNKAFHCQVCEIYVNSETQLKQHMSSRRHKDRLAGKPPKPKYSPYNKLQKNAALASKLALQPPLTKTLATRFLPSPPPAAAVCAMPGPLASPPAAATTLFQAPILPPPLFRTPPAHVRPTPPPIVFAPY